MGIDSVDGHLQCFWKSQYPTCIYATLWPIHGQTSWLGLVKDVYSFLNDWLWAQHPIWMVLQAWVTGRIAACTLVLLQHTGRYTIRGCYVQTRSTVSVMLSGVGKSRIASRYFLHGCISEVVVELPGWGSVGVRCWFRSANSAVFSLITNTNLSGLRTIQYVSGVCIIWASHLPWRKIQ